jgi:hypothetical protein
VERQSCGSASECGGEEANEKFASALRMHGVRRWVRQHTWARSETIDSWMETVGGGDDHGPVKAAAGIRATLEFARVGLGLGQAGSSWAGFN